MFRKYWNENYFLKQYNLHYKSFIRTADFWINIVNQKLKLHDLGRLNKKRNKLCPNKKRKKTIGIHNDRKPEKYNKRQMIQF